MNLERYNYEKSSDFFSYVFYSEGPKGVIKKIVRYTPVILNTTLYFNLGFGDWDEAENRINDLVNTNNRDSEKVLATIAHTVVEFTKYYPKAIVYAEGSTLSRTRLYQMGINKIWNEIEEKFDLYGFVEAEGFHPFERNSNYQAFVISRKNQ